MHFWQVQMLTNLSLRFKIPLRVSALILLVGAVVGLSLLLRASELFREDLQLSSENMSRILARTLTPALLHDDIWKAYEIISTPFTVGAAANSLQARVVFVLDPQRRIYMSTQPQRFPILSDFGTKDPELKIVRRYVNSTDNQQQFIDREGLDNIYVITPIESDNVLLGTLIMGYSNELFSDRFFTYTKRGVFTTLLIIAVLLPVGAYWGRQLAVPLVELAKCMRQVGSTVPEEFSCGERLSKTGDELGQLNRQFQDMVEQLREKAILEKQIITAERLAAIGRFTTGIAHEINNPLGGMLNATSTLRRHGDLDPLTEKTLDLIERGLLQIKETVGALLVEASLEAHPLTHHDVEDTRTLVASEASKKHIAILWHNDLHGEINLPSTLVRQILINLLLNAIQAVPGSGIVDCRIEPTDGTLDIRVRNSGTQIEDEVVSHLFEPFVTGNESGRGLGLWVTYQIVTQLKGNIEAHSTESGTEFAVNLPIPLEEAA